MGLFWIANSFDNFAIVPTIPIRGTSCYRSTRSYQRYFLHVRNRAGFIA